MPYALLVLITLLTACSSKPTAKDLSKELETGKITLIGPTALIQRLSAWRVALAILPRLKHSSPRGYKVPWDKIDLSDPEKPRLLCQVDQLEPII